MVTVESEKAESLGNFIGEVIFDSRVSIVIELIGMAEKALGPELWKSFCSYGSVQSTIGNLVDCIARQMAMRFADMDTDSIIRMRQDMLDLFDEIGAKAQKIGEPIDISGIIKVYNL